MPRQDHRWRSGRADRGVSSGYTEFEKHLTRSAVECEIGPGDPLGVFGL